jgi:hypothetical protein
MSARTDREAAMGECAVFASPPCGASEADWGFDTKRRLAVLVLAGGRGARIGGGKPDRKLAGRRLIDRARDCRGSSP